MRSTSSLAWRFRLGAGLAVSVLGATALAGCGTSGGSSSPSASPSASFRQLTATELQASLLQVSALPPGYQADPPAPTPENVGPCEAPLTIPGTQVEQTFANPQGQQALVRIKQYTSTQQAVEALAEITRLTEACTPSNPKSQGVTYTQLSTAGYPAARAVGATDGQHTAVQMIAIVGPSLVAGQSVQVGAGDAMVDQAKQLAGDLLVKQDAAYRAAATS